MDNKKPSPGAYRTQDGLEKDNALVAVLRLLGVGSVKREKWKKKNLREGGIDGHVALRFKKL